jgi:2-phosphosulfolactate phosphatase
MIEVALCPTEIRRFSTLDLDGVTAVVFDVLRATSSMITGLAHGVEAILPVQTIEEARACKANDPALLLAGERGGLPIATFDLGNSPDEFKSLNGRRVVMTTTNGTVAIQSVKHASTVLIGSLLNLDALADFVSRSFAKDLLLVCAGTVDDFSLEDAIGAGALVARLSVEGGLSDSAVLVRSLYERVGDDFEKWLSQTKNGRALREIGKNADISHCARLSVYNIVGKLCGDAIIRVETIPPSAASIDWR